MHYIDVGKAREMPGLRLVLTSGVPGPWGEGIKKVLEYKNLEYTPVAQYGGQANDELVAWTGVRNAPVIIYDSGPPLIGWSEMILFAERMAPTPALLPEDSKSRVLVFGILNELCGEWGFGWCRRLMTFQAMSSVMPPTDKPDPMVAKLTADYKINRAAMAAAPKRVAGILGMLSERLLSQQSSGSKYLVGNSLTAADIYWATFSAQLDPLPQDVNPMSDVMRRLFTLSDPVAREGFDPILIRHRDNVFKYHLKLPLDF
jgi:glutathione S-transferase